MPIDRSVIGLARQSELMQQALDPVAQAVRDAATSDDAWEIISRSEVPGGLSITTSVYRNQGGDELLAEMEAAGLRFWYDINASRWRAKPQELVAQHADRLAAGKALIEQALYVRVQRVVEALIPPVIARFTNPPTDRMNDWLRRVDEAERSYDLERIKRLCGVKN